MASLDYQGELNKLKTAQRNAAVADLENTRNQALSNLQAEQAQNAGNYNQQRSTANVQNRMNAKNFQEYLASTGRANTGLTAQAKMQYDNNLNTSLNNLNAGEAAALADINRRTTDAQNAYNTGLAGANANIEANYIQNLLEQREKELNRQFQENEAKLNRAFQEKQFAESVRQFNENLALQRAQLQSRFSGGSGGGGSSRSSSSSGRTSAYKDTGHTVLSGTSGHVVPTASIAGLTIADKNVYKKGNNYYIKSDTTGKMTNIKNLNGKKLKAKK